MVKPVEDRSLPVLRGELEKLRGVYERCSEIFKGKHTKHTEDALERVHKAIEGIEEEIQRRARGD